MSSIQPFLTLHVMHRINDQLTGNELQPFDILKFARVIFYEKDNFYPHQFHSSYDAVYLLQKRKLVQGMHQWQSLTGS